MYRRRQWQPTLVLLPGKSHGRRSLVGYSPWGGEESDMTEQLHFHFSLSCIWEGNGNPLQYSHLEKPRDRGAWWAAIYGVAQSWTRLKRLSSSSSSCILGRFFTIWATDEIKSFSGNHSYELKGLSSTIVLEIFYLVSKFWPNSSWKLHVSEFNSLIVWTSSGLRKY